MNQPVSSIFPLKSWWIPAGKSHDHFLSQLKTKKKSLFLWESSIDVLLPPFNGKFIGLAHFLIKANWNFSVRDWKQANLESEAHLGPKVGFYDHVKQDKQASLSSFYFCLQLANHFVFKMSKFLANLDAVWIGLLLCLLATGHLKVYSS